jgi:protease YdgD
MCGAELLLAPTSGSYGPVTSTRPPRVPDNTCNFSHNQQCDERDITAGGQCGSGTDSADCDDSCEFARDGECDDQRGTGACHHGTDSFLWGPPPPPPG